MHQIIDNLALQKSLHVVDNDLLADVDQLHKTLGEICNSGIIRYVIFDPAFEVADSIRILPSHVLSTFQVTRRRVSITRG